ncbi:hypothetical protein SCHPADRAFT_897537, partial [Schizopora paradoxa]
RAYSSMVVSNNASKKALKMTTSKTPPRQTTLPFQVVDKATPVPRKKKTTGKSQGRPTMFTPDEYKWIRGTFPVFDDKYLNSTGTEEEKADLKAWKEEKWKELKATFANSLNRTGSWRSKFMEVFKNRVSNTLKKKKNTPPTLKMPPMLLLHGQRTDGFHKFREANKKEITEKVQQLRKGKNLSHYTFLPMFQERLSNMWRALTAEEKEGWDNFIVEDENDVTPFDNQATFIPTIFALLAGTQGSEKQQCGDCAHFLVSTFRTQDGHLQSKVVIVDGTRPGKDDVKNKHKAIERFVKAWGKRCQETIPEAMSIPIAEGDIQ